MPSMPPGYVQQSHFIDKRAAEAIATIDPDEDLWDTKTCARKLGVSFQWVTIGRHKGYGPPFVKLGPRRVRYRPAAVIAWLREREFRSVAENPNREAPRGRSPGRPRKAASSVGP